MWPWSEVSLLGNFCTVVFWLLFWHLLSNLSANAFFSFAFSSFFCLYLLFLNSGATAARRYCCNLTVVLFYPFPFIKLPKHLRNTGHVQWMKWMYVVFSGIWKCSKMRPCKAKELPKTLTPVYVFVFLHVWSVHPWSLSFSFQRKWACLSIGQEVEGKLPVQPGG